MERLGRLTGLGLLIAVGCGGAKPAPPAAAASPAPSALAKEPVEKADLSPVATPPELFVLGRLKRPGPIGDALAKWAGLPVRFRSLLGRELDGLDRVIAWDAPVELAVALTTGGRRPGVRAVVSIGVISLSDTLNAARDRGRSPERIAPEVYGFSGPDGVRCAAGPALGGASARLVCGAKQRDVEELFAYATRGLPNENLGNRDLEVELRAEPLRQRFSSEIAGMRLFAGFLLRQVELDSPRFDRALADATYGVADELVLEVEDTDTIELGGSLDEASKNVSLELAWRFRSTRSWLAGLTKELSSRPAPPPPALARLPGDATSAGYTVDLGTERMTPVRAALTEVVDAYLEHEKLGKGTREHAKRLLTKLVGFTAASVQSKGSLPAGTHTDAEKKLGWRLSRVELPVLELERMLQDLHALFGDRALFKALAKRFEFDAKVQPKSELGPLTGKGVPAGSRVMTLTLPQALTEEIQKSAGSRFKLETKQPVKLVLVLAPDGPAASVVVVSSDKKDATERLRAFLGEGGKRLGARADLAALHATRALHGEFFSLLGLLDSTDANAAKPGAAPAPSQADTPIVASYTAFPGPPLVLSAALTIPSAAFADAPGMVLDASRSF